MIYYLYKTTNIITNKYYIGVHSTNNIEDGYIGSGKYLKNSIKKYGKDSFTKEILEFFSSRDEMYKREFELIKGSEIDNSKIYNLASGGKGGFEFIHLRGLGGAKEGRKAADEAMLKKYGDNFRSIIGIAGGKKAVEKCRKLGVGLFNPDIQKLGSVSALSEESKLKKANTLKNIKHQQGKTNSQFGTCWITKDSINKKIKKEELEIYTSSGWKKGRTLNATNIKS